MQAIYFWSNSFQDLKYFNYCFKFSLTLLIYTSFLNVILWVNTSSVRITKVALLKETCWNALMLMMIGF